MEPEIEGRFERLENLLGEVEKRFEDRLGEVEERLGEVEERLSEQLRDMQTEILKAFLPWQEQVRIQFRELEANTGNSVFATKQRMEIMERRLGEIEKRLLMYPPAA
jgi:tetrahydromethanopterin S-methyltransferase subunit G